MRLVIPCDSSSPAVLCVSSAQHRTTLTCHNYIMLCLWSVCFLWPTSRTSSQIKGAAGVRERRDTSRVHSCANGVHPFLMHTTNNLLVQPYQDLRWPNCSFLMCYDWPFGHLSSSVCTRSGIIMVSFWSPFDNEFTKLLFSQVDQVSLSESIQYPCLVIFIKSVHGMNCYRFAFILLNMCKIH